MRTKRALPIAALVAAAIVIAVIAGAPRSDGTPLDPDSTGAQGTKALVLLLREHGTTVNIGPDIPTPGVGVALVLVDNLSDDQRTRLQAWVQQGGTLIVTDPGSDLAVAAAFVATEDGRLTPRCSFPPVVDVGLIEVPGAP